MAIRSYRIEIMPPQLPGDVIERLSRVESATVGHYLHDRFMDPGLRPVIDGRRIAGTAVTLSIPGPDSTLLYYAMDRVRPGDVLIIDRSGDRRHACWGGFMSAVASLRGIAGVVLDGVVTDPTEIRAREVPMWARGVSPITTKRLNLGGGFNIPVSCGGIAVRSGDAVLADDCGVLVVPPDELPGLIERALADQADEGRWVDELKAGKMLNDMVDIDGLISERDRRDGGTHG